MVCNGGNAEGKWCGLEYFGIGGNGVFWCYPMKDGDGGSTGTGETTGVIVELMETGSCTR